MPHRLVVKFGGSSLASPAKVRHAAGHVAREIAAGHQVAVVVSAMGKETDRLVRLYDRLAQTPNPAEYDAMTAAGEQISAAAMALALGQRQIAARSWTGWQIPITTAGHHSGARITGIAVKALERALKQNQVPVITGFQGVSREDRITTLGRGGSDASAVALAAALKARRCDIYTDVAGVYDCDPRLIAKAGILRKIAYEEMLEMASLGARVLQTRAVSLARRARVRLRVRAAFAKVENASAGSLVCSEEEIVEQNPVTGLVHSRDEAKITLAGLADRPGVAADIMSPLAEEGILLDMIVQTAALEGQRTDLTFTVPRASLKRARAILAPLQKTLGWKAMAHDSKVAKVSVVGIGMKAHSGIAAAMFRALAEKNINIQAISTSEIKISVLVEDRHMEAALAVLHKTFLQKAG